MTKPKVTVTLGRFGHKVVRRDQLDGGNNAQLFSGGSKRLIRDRLGSNGESSSYSVGKRQRGVGVTLRPDKRIGKNDLRLKLLRKKRSLQIQRGTEELRTIYLREKLQRHARPSHTVRVMPPQQSRPIEVTIPKQRSLLFSPEQVSRPARGTPRISNQMREVPSVRSTNVSRPVQVRGGGVPLNYRPTGPASLPLREAPESSQPARPPLSSTSIIQSSPYLGEEPTTVSGLLQSLGLSKYYINFQAEEVDMFTLRQMGDTDLKEMGIPMGPRKKILLAVKSRTFRRPP